MSIFLVCIVVPARAQERAGTIADSLAKIKDDWRQTQMRYQEALRGTKSREERDKVQRPDPKSYAERCWQKAKQEPNTEQSTEALIWLIQSFPKDEHVDQAVPLVEKYLASASLDVIDRIFESSSSLSKAAVHILPKVKAQPELAQASSILARACYCLLYGPPNYESTAKEAVEFLISRYPTSREIQVLPNWLSQHDDAEWAAGQLRAILGSSQDQQVRLYTKFALAEAIAGMNLASQDEAVRLLNECLGEARPEDHSDEVRRGRELLRIIEELGLGKPAKEVVGKDLEDKPFRLSDYRGKVVLLDFWGFW